MRNLFLTAASAVILAACGAQNPDDGAQYSAGANTDTTAMQPNTDTTAAQSGDKAPAAKAAVPTPDNTGISNTQNFRAIKKQETIESDKAKLEALKSSYQQVDPDSVSVPSIPSNEINIAAYALKQKNAVGQKIYQRSSIRLSNCSRYRNDPDAAQRAFLRAGGPERDPRRLDPDGDGFACSWNPDFYRKMLNPAG